MTAAIYRGFKPKGGVETIQTINEYFDRQRLAKLGITVPMTAFTADKIDGFLVIDREIDRLRQADENKRRLKAKTRGG